MNDMEQAIKTIEILMQVLSVKLNELNLPSDEHVSLRLAKEMDTLLKAKLILKYYEAN